MALGVGARIAAGVGSAAGVGVALAVGAGVSAATGASAGTGVASATGAALAAAVGSGAGVGSALGTGASIVVGVGAASGIGAALGIAAGGTVGSAAGVGTATGVGASISVATNPQSAAFDAGSLGPIKTWHFIANKGGSGIRRQPRTGLGADIEALVNGPKATEAVVEKVMVALSIAPEPQTEAEVRDIVAPFVPAFRRSAPAIGVDPYAALVARIVAKAVEEHNAEMAILADDNAAALVLTMLL